MSWLSKLFGGSGAAADAAPKAEPEIYLGFDITPGPLKESGGWRVAAMIEKDGKSHQLIRADVISDFEEAKTTSVRKAKQLIDQMGDRLFD